MKKVLSLLKDKRVIAVGVSLVAAGVIAVVAKKGKETVQVEIDE
jgi:hypothetical protein